MNDYTARETMYNGIPMRSRLEAGYAQWLDRENATWTYEGQAFGSAAGQYLPDFTVHTVDGEVIHPPLFIEVKSEGRGTIEVLERMKVILGTHPDAMFMVVEGSWENNEYTFRVVQRWPEPRPLVTYYVYNVPGCDSWHRLGQRPPSVHVDDYDWESSDAATYKAVAQAVFPEVDFYYEQEPRLYILPAADAPAGIGVWAVAFHKGDACLVSLTPLPWISDYLVGTTQR